MTFHLKKRIYAPALIIMAAMQFFLLGSSAKAQTSLSLESNLQQVYAGDTFIVDLKISSTVSINTIDGTLVFDPKKIAVESIDTSGSIFSLWPVNPTFDNTAGKITLVGGIPGGFSGDSGQALQITFVAKNSGTSTIDFQDTFSALLNNGLGSRVNPWLEPVSITIVKKPIGLAINDTLKTLAQKDTADNYLPLIALIILFLALILIIIRAKSRKFKKID